MVVAAENVETISFELLVTYLGPGFKVPVDVELLLEKLGGKVAVGTDTEDNPVSLRVAADGTFTVFVASNTSYRKDRFTIAHEIGHFVLHRQPCDQCSNTTNEFYRYSKGRDRKDMEANAFAGALLMPKPVFTRFWTGSEYADCSVETKLDRGVQLFQAPRGVVNVRHQMLGL